MTSLSPNVLIQTLLHFSWEHHGGVSDRFEVWSDQIGRNSVVIPVDSDLRDYESLMAKAMRDIQASLGSPALSHIETLRMQYEAGLAFTRWQKETSVHAGLIDWPTGEVFFTSVRASLAAAAKSAREPRRYHGNASTHVAKKFLEATLMGQTQVGSFVVTAHVPTGAAIHTSKTSELHSKSDPKKTSTIPSSIILDKLESALSSAKERLTEYSKTPNLEVFDGIERDGVSYEFADALAKLSANGAASIDIERSQDMLHPDRHVEVTFEPPDSGIFRRLATKLAQDMEPRQETVSGDVTLLSREEEHGIQERTIRLSGRIGGQARKVRVRLSDAQYQQALDAHSREAELRVTGQLEREGKVFWMYSPETVEVVSADAESSEAETDLLF